MKYKCCVAPFCVALLEKCSWWGGNPASLLFEPFLILTNSKLVWLKVLATVNTLMQGDSQMELYESDLWPKVPSDVSQRPL